LIVKTNLALIHDYYITYYSFRTFSTGSTLSSPDGNTQAQRAQRIDGQVERFVRTKFIHL